MTDIVASITVNLDKEMYEWLQSKAVVEGDGKDISYAILRCARMMKDGVINNINVTPQNTAIGNEIERAIRLTLQNSSEILRLVRYDLINNKERWQAVGARVKKELLERYPLLAEKYKDDDKYYYEVLQKMEAK